VVKKNREMAKVLALVRYAEPKQHAVEDSLAPLIPIRTPLPGKR